MTRSEKIQKLGNAIREYRGLYVSTSGQWIHPPKREAATRIVVWLERLRLPVEQSLNEIDNFHSLPEYQNWIKNLGHSLAPKDAGQVHLEPAFVEQPQPVE